jgi:hypothetical protein
LGPAISRQQSVFSQHRTYESLAQRVTEVKSGAPGLTSFIQKLTADR